MQTMTLRDFKSRMGMSLDRVDAGERVTFRRRGHVYAIMPIEEKDTIYPALAAEIEKVRAEYKEGKGVSCRTKKEIADYINSL